VSVNYLQLRHRLRQPHQSPEEELHECQLTAHLQRSPWRAGFAQVRITVRRQQISLSGVVHSYHLKQIAQTLVLGASKRKTVMNHLSVICDQSSQG
jgi:hypothetical protein